MILSLYLAGLFIFIFADKNVVRFNFSILLPIEYEYNHAICYFDPVVKISIKPGLGKRSFQKNATFLRSL